jgi:hypothetical protein
MGDWECQVVEDMGLLAVEVSTKTGGRLTAEGAEALSVKIWASAQEVRRRRPLLLLQQANREAAQKRAAKKTLGGSSGRKRQPKLSATP